VVLAIVGAAVGILMTYGARALMRVFVPTMTQAIVPDWWPWAVLIAVVGALLARLSGIEGRASGRDRSAGL
jgi:hypothetical protein